jgi:hypothetical protein
VREGSGAGCEQIEGWKHTGTGGGPPRKPSSAGAVWTRYFKTGKANGTSPELHRQKAGAEQRLRVDQWHPRRLTIEAKNGSPISNTRQLGRGFRPTSQLRRGSLPRNVTRHRAGMGTGSLRQEELMGGVTVTVTMRRWRCGYCGQSDAKKTPWNRGSGSCCS